MSKSVVPRGFSRFYVLSLLKERAMTGKEIMDETTKRSNGSWKPSPGLVYPLLGKLLEEGLIVEASNGGYVITQTGEKALQDYENTPANDMFGTVMRLGVYGRMMAQDISDRVISMIGMMREDISKLSADQKKKYRDFLRSELNRMEGDENQQQPTGV